MRDALRQVANPPGEDIEPGDFQHAFELINQGQKVNYRLRRLTPLSGLQEDTLQRLGLRVALYGQLEIHAIGS